MTRLNASDIRDTASQLSRYDIQLSQKTGRTLRGIACHTFGIPEKMFQSLTSSVEIGIVPFKSGEGIIKGFSKTVEHIVQHIGFKVFITRQTDVAGIAEAVERNAEVLMMADDYRFVALNIKSNRMVDNAESTGRGFVAGLDLMTAGLKGKKVLIIGCGRVGRNATLAAIWRGAHVSVFDINPLLSNELAKEIERSINKKIKVENALKTALARHHLIVEASNTADVIRAEDLHPQTQIAAPGMPLGLTPKAVQKISRWLLHDPLQTGVAVMAVDSVLSRSVEEWRVMLPYGTWIARHFNGNPPQKNPDKKIIENRKQKTEDRRRTTDDGKQTTDEDSRQRTDVLIQRADELLKKIEEDRRKAIADEKQVTDDKTRIIDDRRSQQATKQR